MITASFKTKNCSAFCTANQSTKTNLKNYFINDHENEDDHDHDHYQCYNYDY